MKLFLLFFGFLLFSFNFCLADNSHRVGGNQQEEVVRLEEIVVTPYRMLQSSYETVSNVTKIDAEEIKSSGFLSIADILKEKTGINVYNSGTEKTVKIDIRGFADTSVSNILLLVDGRKVNPIDMSGPDWSQIPLEIIERIEIIKGASSILYGDNAVGGVVNVITKKGEGPVTVRLGAKYGSYSMQQEDMEISGADNKISYYLFANYFDTEGYRTNSNVRAKNFNTRMVYALFEDLSFDFTVGWHEDDYGMPGGLNDGELAQYGRRGSANKKDHASTKDRNIKLSIDAKPAFFNKKLGNFVTDIFYRNRDSYSWFDYGIWGATAYKYKIDTQGINFKWMHDSEINKKRLDIVAGIDYYDVEHVIKGSGSGLMASQDALTIYKKELGFYLHSDYELINNLFINGGARYQEADYRFDQKKASSRYETRDVSESVFAGGFKYQYAEDSNLYASVKETFRFLATDEWYSTVAGLNTNLKQQTGIQYEIGVKHNFFDTVFLNGTIYWIDLKNEIYFNPDPSPGQNENYNKTRRKGLELGVTADLLKLVNINFLDSLKFYSNYTYQQPKFRGGIYSGDIPMVPRNKANCGLNIGFLKNYNFSLTGSYTGKRYAINDTKHETAKVKDYFVWNLKLSYENDTIEFYTVVNNVFDKKYNNYVVKSTSSISKDYYPAPERNFMIGIKYHF